MILSKEGPWRIVHLGVAEIKEIKKEVEGYVSEWLLDTSRQNIYQTHEDTFMYQLKELDYDWNLKDKIHSTSPNNFKIKNANDEIKKIYQKLEDWVDGPVIRSEVISMPRNTRIRTHKDQSDLLYLSRRFHIPIITNEQCIFTVEDEKFNLKEGNIYELNNRKYHSVENNSNKDRIHLIVDLLPNQYTKNVIFL
jgi:hypothetical protein